MIGKPIQKIYLCTALVLALIVVSACGTAATPEWADEAQATRAALESTAAHLTEIAPTATPTNTSAPTETPVPPTATPTETPVAIETEEPTEEPTEAPTEEPVAEDSLEDVIAAADAEAGEVAFNEMRTMPEGAVWACSQCHSVTPDEMRLIGPGLWNIAVHAETRVEDMEALDYIHESIVDPNAFIVPPDANGVPFPENLMPPHYGDPDILPEDELNNIIAYLLTLQ